MLQKSKKCKQVKENATSRIFDGKASGKPASLGGIDFEGRTKYG